MATAPGAVILIVSATGAGVYPAVHPLDYSRFGVWSGTRSVAEEGTIGDDEEQAV